MNDEAVSGKAPTTLQTVERALAFLECVATSSRPPTVRDVSTALQLNITTCYHLLRTLSLRGYIERQPDATLILGSRVGVLARGYQDVFDLDQRLSALVHGLARQTAETAYLSTLEGSSVMLRVLVEGSQPLRVAGLSVGQTGNEHRRSSGKAVLAHLGPADRNSVLAASLRGLPDEARAATLQELDGELERTRQRGWSLDVGESSVGISSVGAVVLRPDGSVYGAVGVVTPTTRMERSRASYAKAVTTAAQEASRLLLHSGEVA